MIEFVTNPLIEQAAVDRHDGLCCRNQFCKVCGSHVSGYNCNEALNRQRPEAAGEWDWWVACDNANCIHAHGEGIFQDTPDWVYKKWAAKTEAIGDI